MRLINVETLKLEEFFDDKTPPYAILSHTWGAPGEEVSFSDIEAGNIEKPGKGTTKLKGCCNQAKEDGIGYAWIDTCCINKDSSRELDEAINSMFQWYRKASVCYAYLSDVPPGDNYWDPGSKFFASRWFLRGWTLQELLAPKKLCFYDQTWKSIDGKEDISNEIETITGIPQQFLLGWEDLRKASVAQRMSWAAKRKTTRKEDIAYCLLGIFDVSMPMIYGEGERALSRLQQEIMKHTGDHSILAWGLDAAESIPRKSTDVVSAGILTTAPADFANCGSIVLRKQDATLVDTFDISGGYLRVHLSLHTASAGEIYGLLNCGPEHNTEQVVGIPLRKVVSGASSDKYLRPQGQYPVLLSKTASTGVTKAIHIRMTRQNRTHEAGSRRYWLRINGHRKINLKLSSVHPPVCWEDGRALIAKGNDPDEIITRHYLARFCTIGEGSRDFVVELKFEIQGLQVQTRCHIMTLSKDTTLEALSQKLIYMRPEAFGKQTASNGSVNVKVTAREEQVAQEPVFIVRLAEASSSPETTVDATLELQQVDLKLEFLRILQEEDNVREVAERLDQQREKQTAALDSMKGRLAVVEENLRKLGEEKKLLIDGLEKETQEVDLLTKRHNEIMQRQHKLSEQGSEIQRRLDELHTKQGPDNWLETVIKTQLDVDQMGCSLKAAGDSNSDSPQLPRAVQTKHNIDGQTPLSWAAANGHEAIVKLLLERGSNVEAKDNIGRTPLRSASTNGHEEVVKLLLERGADVETKDNNSRTPLHSASVKGYKDVVKLLLERGADVETKDKNGWTPLLEASFYGHEAVAKLLLERGADVETKDNYSRTPLHSASVKGNKGVVKLLLERGADIETKDNDGRTPLRSASTNGHEEVVKLLLERGADIETKDNNSRTPLHSASAKGYKEVVKLLLERGADLEAKDNDSWTPLHSASVKGNKEVVKLLLERGADLEAKDNDSWTPLLWAADHGHEAVVKLLLERGANIEIKDNDGWTPLRSASANRKEAVVKLLRERGANVEAEDNNDRTPLRGAAANGHEAVTKLQSHDPGFAQQQAGGILDNSSSPPSNPVFGVSLDQLYARDGMPVPLVVLQCIQAVDLYGLKVEGIYRISGVVSQIQTMKKRFDSNAAQMDLRNPETFQHNVNNVASLLKQFFRDLPEPLLTRDFYTKFIDAARIDDESTRRDSIHALINALPDPNYATLRALILHLRRVEQSSDVNRMSAANLSICWASSITGPPQESSIAEAELQGQVIRTILENVLQIFDED